MAISPATSGDGVEEAAIAAVMDAATSGYTPTRARFDALSGGQYWRLRWVDADGKRRSKYLGKEETGEIPQERIDESKERIAKRKAKNEASH